MFNSILVPVDLTDKAKRAVDTAASLVSGRKAEIHLLHVIEKIEYVEPRDLKDLYDTLETKAKRYLSILARRLRDKGISVVKTVVIGKRVNTILGIAEKQDADLIILACPPTDPSSANFGTISSQVAIRSACNVLLLK